MTVRSTNVFKAVAFFFITAWYCVSHCILAWLVYTAVFSPTGLNRFVKERICNDLVKKIRQDSVTLVVEREKCNKNN